MRQGARDQSLFIMKLSEKAPLLSGLAPEVTDRFRVCEAKALPPDDGAPLVLCAVTDAICVGVPSEPVWDRDRLPLDFQELLPDGGFADAHEEIDNLTRSVHAGPNCRPSPHAASTPMLERRRPVEPTGAGIPTLDVRPRR